jgi:single-strand DNA-binding protein
VDTYLCMQGNLVADPVQKSVGDARVTRFRLAASGRRFDSAQGDWVSTDAVFMSVSCWRQLGDNVMQSLRKGDTVIVHGRLRFREYDDPANAGQRRQAYEIDASSIGPDLSRYVAQLARPVRDLPVVPAQEADAARVAAESAA